MTIQFSGTLKVRFRISLFGHDLFVGPWRTQPVELSQVVPAESTVIHLPDGFTSTVSESGTSLSMVVLWEGLPLLSESVPIGGSIPVSLQPIKGVILAGTFRATE